MKEEVLFLKSPLKEKIYGGTRIQRNFGFHDAMDQKIGEYWAISAHDNGPSSITNGAYKGQTLKEVYATHRELFNDDTADRFPLLVKINEITSPVSVQVHPDDAYARKYEQDSGKAEFCLFLDVEEGTKLVRGHTAKTKEEFAKMAQQQDWEHLLLRKPVKTGDYVYTPAGVVHGVEGRMMMAEVQQSSDVTYRIYDYDNVDVDGKPRQLHLQQALETVCIPHKEPKLEVHEEMIGKNHKIGYVDNAFFTVTRYTIQEQLEIANTSYSLCLVLDGKGILKLGDTTYEVSAGTAFIITSQCSSYQLSGNLDLLVSEPGKVTHKEAPHV